jgi:hypothetical protein
MTTLAVFFYYERHFGTYYCISSQNANFGSASFPLDADSNPGSGYELLEQKLFKNFTLRPLKISVADP